MFGFPYLRLVGLNPSEIHILVTSEIRVLVTFPVLVLQLTVVGSDPSKIHVLIPRHALLPEVYMVVSYQSMNLVMELHHALL